MGGLMCKVAMAVASSAPVRATLKTPLVRGHFL